VEDSWIANYLASAPDCPAGWLEYSSSIRGQVLTFIEMIYGQTISLRVHRLERMEGEEEETSPLS